MNHHLTCSSAILCSFLASGCSTHTVNQTRNVSSSAVAYTSGINQLLKDTKERVIAMDTKQLAMSRSTDNREENQKKFNAKNKALDNWITEVNLLRDQNKLLHRYFNTLQIMIEDSEKNDMSETLGRISLSISELNQLQAEKRGKGMSDRTLTLSQSEYVGSLSQSLVSSHHANKIKQVLIRDRDIINRQIALHQRQFELISSIYERRVRFDNREHYTDRVLNPYIDTSPNSLYQSHAWQSARIEWIENKQILNRFESVKEANKAFREAWIDILQGKQDGAAVTVILSDISGVVHTARQLKDSYKYPPRNPYVGNPTPY